MSRASLLLALFLTISPLSVATAQTTGSEVVRTRDGAMYRGTVIESVPGSHVVLLLATGETRRFASADVESVTSAPAAAPAPIDIPPALPAEPPGVVALDGPNVSTQGGPLTLRVTATRPGQTLLVQSQVAGVYSSQGAMVAFGYERLCTAPCDLTLQPGNYSFAVSDEAGRPRAVRRPVLIGQDGELAIGVQSRRRHRVVRWLTGITLAAIGAPLLVTSLTSSDYYESDINAPRLAVGSTLLMAGMVVCTVARFTFDRGRVEYTPGN